MDKARKHIRLTFSVGEKTFILPDAFSRAFSKFLIQRFTVLLKPRLAGRCRKNTVNTFLADARQRATDVA